MVAHPCHPSIQEAEIERLRVQDQPELHSETLSQITKQNKQTKTGNGLKPLYIQRVLGIRVTGAESWLAMHP
jgi:hypothetical protein